MKFRVSPLSTRLRLTLLLLALSCVGVHAQQSLNSNRAEYEKAVKLYESDDDAGAIEALKKVVHADRNDADAWNLLGRAYYRSGEIWRAGDAFRQLVRLRPYATEAYAKIAFALILGGQNQEAVTSARRAIELGDQSVEPRYALAEASFRAGDYSKAVDQADEALKISPGFGLALITRSMALYFLDRYPESIAGLEDFLKLNPNDLDGDVWREQLRKLRLFDRRNNSPEAAAERSKTVFRGKDVTTKARVLEKPEPTYTEPARKAGVTGTVVLRAVVSEAGEITDIFIWQPLSHGLNAKAIGAAKKIRFVPATKDGQPVAMWIELQYNFNLY